MDVSCVVVVEDEADLRDAIVEYFSAMGFEALGAANGVQLRDIVREKRVDVVLLDVGLPGEDGLSLCRWLRRETACGIIMATGAGEPIDRVVGLEIGADDYVVKPYDQREMLARVRSVLRRISPSEPMVQQEAAKPQPDRKCQQTFGPFQLDLPGRRLLDLDGRDLGLTAAEMALVEIFATRPGRPLSRALLSQLADGREAPVDDRAIDVRITRLRRKLATVEGGGALIRTLRGEGYRYDPTEP